MNPGIDRHQRIGTPESQQAQAPLILFDLTPPYPVIEKLNWNNTTG